MTRPVKQKKEKKEYHGFKAVIRDPQVIIAIVLLIAALCLIFIPIGDRGDNPTNLKFGLDLEGGSWIQLEFQGDIVNIEPLSAQSAYDVADKVATALGCTVTPMTASSNGTIDKIEVAAKFDEDELKEAFTSAGATYKGKSAGVSSTTAESAKRTLESKLNSLGTNDVKINIMSSGDTAQYVRVELAGVNITEAQELLGSQGKFEIRIETSDGGEKYVLSGDSITSVQSPSKDTTSGSWGVGFTLNEDGAKKFQQACIETGATTNPSAHNISMYLDDEQIFSAPLATDLAKSLAKSPTYKMQATVGSGDEGLKKAQELEIHLRSGALPVDVKTAGVGSTSAALGDYFKIISVIAAIAALLAVAVFVYIRYRLLSIVIPMILTNISEVIMLLGFSVVIQQQLDLAAIAAVIAVLGTGIDQLIIITDEVVHEGVMPAKRLYLKRLKRALTIILTSAATVIIAMLPLIFMDLSTLKGFAIVNIVGILIGVIVTRPAYGKIIMEIMDSKKNKDKVKNTPRVESP